MLEDCGKCGKTDHVYHIEEYLSSSYMAPDLFTFLHNSNQQILCVYCMDKFKEAYSDAQQYKNEDFIEGIHYYKEGHLLVLTMAYHIHKGYCCKNNCRHCPYGYKKRLPNI